MTLALPSEPTRERADRATASQWRLVWWRFKRHRLAVWSGVVVLLIYVVAIFADVLAPRAPDTFNARFTYAPPQAIHFFGRDAQGTLHPMYVHGFRSRVDPVALSRIYEVDTAVLHPVGFFVKGDPYRLWGLFDLDRHVIGAVDPTAPFFLLGADRLGRDVLSRTIHGTRVSMSIGLVGVAISLVLGILIGGLSGLVGGAIDEGIQRVIEFLKSIPTIPLWMGLAAAIPVNTDPVTVYFWITVILALVAWTDVARVVRGRFLALKTEDFVTAARLDGCSRTRLVFRHMVPSFASHIIATVTLAIPAMILAETSLSFLGIGLKEPVVSWGVLLIEAQNILSIATAPWLFAPGGAIVIAVLALNFLGDGLRDAADPYA